MDFIAIDVETANADMASICQLGAVRFVNGLAVERLSVLVDPEDHFDGMNISVHGIRPEDVAGAPTFGEAFGAFEILLGKAVVAHHTPFDRVAICRAAAKHGFADPACEWLDTAKVTRRTWEHRSRCGYGLAAVCEELRISFQHHDAAQDAEAAGLVLVEACRITGMSLIEWLDRVKRPIALSLEQPNIRHAHDDGTRSGDLIVFTGALEIPRREAADLAAQAGFDVEDRVTARTTILVIGDQDARRPTWEAKSGKHQKAEKMIAAGAPIRIITEKDFQVLVGMT